MGEVKIRVGLPGEYVDPGVDCTKDWLTGEDSPSLTVQADADACDINKILKRFEKTGVLTHVNRVQAAYADVSDVTDYHSSLNLVLNVQEAFEGLPANVRAYFKNDPSLLLEALQDPAQQDDLVALGVVAPKVEPPAEPLGNAEGGAGGEATQGTGA